jgi:hypothetical protein
MSLKSLLIEKLLGSFFSSDTPAGELVSTIEGAIDAANDATGSGLAKVEAVAAYLKEKGFGQEVITLVEELGDLFNYDTDKIEAFLQKVVTVSDTLISLSSAATTTTETTETTDDSSSDSADA